MFIRPYVVKLVFILMVPLVIAVACTRYQPVGQGARVPWAQSLLAGKAGPLADNRYRVGPTDSLEKISERYGLAVATLAAANNIEDPYILYTGEVLRIPRTSATSKPRPLVRREVPSTIEQTALPEQLPSLTPETTKERWKPRRRPRPGVELRPPVTTAEEAVPKQVGKRYAVEPGDSLTVIARRHGLGLGELAAANNLEPPFLLRSGQELIIPPTESERLQPSSPGSSANVALVPPPPLSAEGFLWPVQGELIGTFEDNSAKGRSGGVNIAARAGTPVIAAENGVVAYAGEALSGYGRMILIRHADGYVTLYAHNAILLVREGEIVQRGQNIAEVGSSGDVIQSQLHFELRKGREPIDPAKILAGSPERQFGDLNLMPKTSG